MGEGQTDDFSVQDLSDSEMRLRSTNGNVLKEAQPLADEKDAAKEFDQRQLLHANHLDNMQIAFSLCYDISVVYGALILKKPACEKLLFMQYKNGLTGLYGCGRQDAYFMATLIVNLMLIRSAMMQLFSRVAHSVGIHTCKAIQRFKEQSWEMVYYGTLWTCGMVLYWHCDYFLNADMMYLGWPQHQISFWFKLYYLTQTSYWLQQIIVINIEEKRKDHVQMFCHHIITSALCIGSYATYYMRVGHVILLLMDIVDVFLSTAKVLKYSGFTRVCDIMFLVFMFSWIVLRHGVYNYILYHLYKYGAALIGPGCRTLVPEMTTMCFTQTTIDVFLWLLGGLQVLTIVWLCMIVRVAWRVVRGGEAEDTRSDGEVE